jgi:ABC-type glycerol-3-phosphate transport system substrate-binding protein
MAISLSEISNYVTRGGFLIPLDKYFTNEELDGFVPVATKAAKWNGRYYAPPLTNSAQLLWWNKDLLAQAGVTVRPSDVNNRLTYEEVVEYARQALAKLDPNRTNGISGLIFEQVSRTYQMCPIANSMGAKSIGDDGFTVDGIINGPEWVKAMTWYQNLYKDGLALRGFTSDETDSLFRSGKILFMVGGPWNNPSVVDYQFEVGFAPVPAFKGYEDKVGTGTGSWHIGIPPSSKKQDMAAAFVKWMTLGEGNTMYIKAIGQPPATMKAVNEILNDPNADPVMKIALYESVHTAVPRAITPGYPEYATIMDGAFEDIRNGSEVKSRLDMAVRDLNAALAKYK